LKKISPNHPCPCGSGSKYKKCCQRYHKGAVPPDALSLMKSRYSAYAAGVSRYIMESTHPQHPDTTLDPAVWRAEIEDFSRHTDFLRLEIMDVRAGEHESTVTFRATLSSGVMEERSRFLFEGGRWLYLEGVMIG